MDFRVALGFDLHKLASGRKLILCGVEIPYEKGLLGHSDADVGLHALIDALLSAGGLSDIGTLFPDTDPAFKDIPSTKLLEKTLILLKEKGFVPSQVDITFICDKPKLSPYYPEMKEKLSQLLNLPISEIGIKAKTTEGIGFGKEEAIACFCVVVIKKLDKNRV